MTDPRTIPGSLDWRHLAGDPDRTRSEARQHALEAVKRGLAAVRTASEGEARPTHCGALAGAHAALADAARLSEAGVSPAVIAKVMRHSSVTMTERYLHLGAADVWASLDAAASRLGQPEQANA